MNFPIPALKRRYLPIKVEREEAILKVCESQHFIPGGVVRQEHNCTALTIQTHLAEAVIL